MRRAALLAVAALALTAADDPLAGRTPGEPQRCLTTSPQQAFRIEGPDLLVLRQGKRWWVTRPEGGCQRLHPQDILIVQPFASQLCRGDRFRTVQPSAPVPSGFCRFGPFVPYTK